MKIKYIGMLLLTCVASGACSRGHSGSDLESVGSSITGNVSAASGATVESPRKKLALSPLEGILSILVAKEGRTWSSFSNVPGVQWTDPAPVKNIEARHSENSYRRGGKLRLAGFGVVDMPNGKVGIDFGLVKGNEGNVSVALNGDAHQVYSISLVKFYPSDNYQEIIQQQLLPDDAVRLISDHCMTDGYGAAENSQKNKFYEVSFDSGLVYVEASVDEDDVSTVGAATLGSTTFDFYRNKPTQIITKMRCNGH